MNLTLYSDYALRLVIFLSSHPEGFHSVTDISGAYGISKDHLSRVAKDLTRRGILESKRGKHGGVKLAVEPASVRLGDFLRSTEPPTGLVECFDAETNTCPLAGGACSLEGILHKAQRAFYDSLNKYSLQDVLQRPQLIRLRLARQT